jgi:hypothetical protein
VLIFEIISSGKEEEVRPTFASTPTIALYGVRLIPRMVAKVCVRNQLQTLIHVQYVATLDKCAIVDAIQILLAKINECIYHFFFVKCFM